MAQRHPWANLFNKDGLPGVGGTEPSSDVPPELL